MAGKLYVVATPIGNLGDLSPRAVQALEDADFIAAEDTRVGARLLNYMGLRKPQVSYFEHNKRQRGEEILARLLSGESCALITDAGTPAISDPGADLVNLCHEAGVKVLAVPGPSALITALSVSGLDCGRFCFEGFLSTSKKSREEHLRQTAREQRTLVFYEAPHKLVRTLRDMLDAYGERSIALCRELTKLHEEVDRTTFSGAIRRFENETPRGEFVLVISGWDPGKEKSSAASDEELLEEVENLTREGVPLSSAVKQVAERHGKSKNALYRKAQERWNG